MSPIKKYMLMGIGAIAAIFVILILYSIITEDPIITTNDTVTPIVNDTIIDPNVDEVLAGFKRQRAIEIPNAAINWQINATGSENISISVSSFAIHNTFLDAWYTLNEEKREVITNEVFENGVIVDSGLIYNRLYFYMPEITVDVNGTVHKATMPKEKFFFEADFLMPEPEEISFFRFTFLKDESLFEKDGEYTFAPQIRVEVYRNTSLGVRKDSIEIYEGQRWFDVVMGMGNDGEFKANQKYNPNIE